MGTARWFTLFSVAEGYPDNPTADDKSLYRNFIYSYGKVLPCQMCRVNFSNHISDDPLTDNDLDSRESFHMWINNLRNKTKNGNFIDESNSNVYYIIVVITVIVFIIFYLRR